jgi:dTDP-4-amino-4,6-dideoxygalactose transaminase
MTIPFLDLRTAHTELRDQLDAAYRRVMDSGWFILGREVEAFESEFVNFCCCHCVAVGNGVDALQIILRAYGIEDVERITTAIRAFQTKATMSGLSEMRTT